MIKFSPLWTDWLIYLLMLAVAIYAYRCSTQPHLRAPWSRVAQNPIGMAMALILSLYLVIGFLDSIHFRESLENKGAATQLYSAEVSSVLDSLVKPLKERTEKTYSAPFALNLYAKESVQKADGSVAREYPRLKYGGAHLADDSEKNSDILRWVFDGTALGILFWLITLMLFLLWSRWLTKLSFAEVWTRLWRGKLTFPWRTIFCVWGMLILLVTITALLSVNYHVLGTDKVGQDILYQSLKSIRTGLVIGTLTTLVMLPFALLLGIMAGYFGGWVDDVIQYIYTTLNSIPGVLLIAAAVLMLQVYIDTHPDMFDTLSSRGDLRLLFLCVILGVTSWTGLCRLLRGETLKLRELDYIMAARAFGVGHAKIITRHIMPNLMHLVLITIVLDFSGLVLAEAVLSYVGVGVDPSMHSWGNMINNARLEMAREPIVWWTLLAAFLFMFVLVLSANLFSDAVRDAFDPRVK